MSVFFLDGCGEEVVWRSLDFLAPLQVCVEGISPEERRNQEERWIWKTENGLLEQRSFFFFYLTVFPNIL